MIDETSTAPRPRRPRWPLAAALTAVAAVALVATLAVAGGLPGSAPGAAAPSAAPVGPAGVPSVEQGGSVVDVGWVTPARRGATTALALGGRAGRGLKAGGIAITKIDGARLSLVTEDGWTRTIDATGATITCDGATIVVGDLAVGDEIMLRQERQADGTFKVTAIRVILPKVAGTVTAITDSSLTLAARDGTKVTVKVTSSTTYRVAGVKDAALEDVKVEMWIVAGGLRNDDGSFTASAVRAAPAGKHKGWGDWKPNRGRNGGPNGATPAPDGAQPPSSNG